jgi:hypothetical protein
VVQGLYGGTAVAASGTAIVGGRYDFLPADDNKEAAVHSQHLTDVRQANARDANMKDTRLVKVSH